MADNPRLGSAERALSRPAKVVDEAGGAKSALPIAAIEEVVVAEAMYLSRRDTSSNRLRLRLNGHHVYVRPARQSAADLRRDLTNALAERSGALRLIAGEPGVNGSQGGGLRRPADGLSRDDSSNKEPREPGA